jgi:hypothetical protein
VRRYAQLCKRPLDDQELIRLCEIHCRVA